MKDSHKLFIFIFVLGFLVSGIYIGMYLLTNDRIEANRTFEIKTAVLSHNHVSTSEGVDATFENEIVVLNRNDHTFYLYEANDDQTEFSAISFIFIGEGLWGTIKGILTLESDFETIVNVSILEQSETPGLGALITDRKIFLDQFKNKKFDPDLLVVKKEGTLANNEVDAIIGATGTSGRMQVILNESYISHYEAFNQIDPVEEFNKEVKKEVLTHLDITFTNNNFENLFDEHITTEIKNDLVVYKANNTYSYIFKGQGVQGEVRGLITLEDDFKTIISVSIFERFNPETPNFGGKIATPEFLDQFIGMELNPTGENIIDNVAAATGSVTAFRVYFIENYVAYYEAFGGSN